MTNKQAQPSVNPFVPSAPFLYQLKTLENHKIFSRFQWVEKV